MFKSTARRPKNRIKSGFIGDQTDSSEAFRRHKPDYWLLIIPLALLIMGLIVVYSISPGLAAAENISQNYYVTKQFIAVGLGLVAFGFFSILPTAKLRQSLKALIWISLIMSAAVLAFGENRWIQIGGFSFQPAELIKFTLVIGVAAFLVERLAKNEIDSVDKTLKPLLLIAGSVFLLVIGLQSDLGSAGVMAAIIGVMAFSAGLPLKKIGVIVGLIAIATVLAVSSTPYRRDRLSTFLNPASDCQTTGYQSCQALIAVGSGGMFGMGLANGVQAYGYLPEAENDSIFAVFGEKFGFVGASAIIGLYGLLFARMRRVVLRTSDAFNRLVVIGILAWLSTQAVINIGAMIGLLPLKGITLPLISYGGTSLVFVMAAIGVVFYISRFSAYSTIRNVSLNKREGQANEDSFGRRGQRRPYYTAPSRR